MRALTSSINRHLMIANACSFCPIKQRIGEVTTVKISPKIAAAAVAALAIGGAGAGTALAAGHSAGARTAVSSTEPTSPDNDSVQQGDQTTPDAPVVATMSSHHQSAKADGEHGQENKESSGESDGPGGHADPAGNVQHEFNGTE